MYSKQFIGFTHHGNKHCRLNNLVICRDLNQPGETGPPELVSKDRPESESRSSRTCGSMLSRHPISGVSIVSRPSRPNWLIWSNTASSRQPPMALCCDTFAVKLHTEAKGRAARPNAIPGDTSECEEPVDSSRKRVLCCWVTGLDSTLPALVTIASCKLTSWLIAVVMSDRRSVTSESKSYTRHAFYMNFSLCNFENPPQHVDHHCDILMVPSLCIWITPCKLILSLL